MKVARTHTDEGHDAPMRHGIDLRPGRTSQLDSLTMDKTAPSSLLWLFIERENHFPQAFYFKQTFRKDLQSINFSLKMSIKQQLIIAALAAFASADTSSPAQTAVTRTTSGASQTTITAPLPSGLAASVVDANGYATTLAVDCNSVQGDACDQAAKYGVTDVCLLTSRDPIRPGPV